MKGKDYTVRNSTGEELSWASKNKLDSVSKQINKDFLNFIQI